MQNGKRSVLNVFIEIAKNLSRNHEFIFSIVKLPYYVILSPYEKVSVYLVKGILRDTNQTTAMLYAGSENSLHQLSSIFFSEPFEISRKGRFPFRHVSSLVDLYHAPDIVAIRVERPLSARYSKRNFLLLPNVNFTLDLRKPIEQTIQRMSRRRRRDFKKIEASGYTYEIHQKSSEVLDFFYWKMYLPYAKKRFEKAAYIKSLLESEIIYRLNGGVLLVKKEKNPLAGILFQIRGNTVLAWSLGVYEGNQDLMRASEAALLYLITWAKAKGIEKLDYGVSMPFLREGIFTYKKEWGMSVRDPTNQSFCALKLNSLTDGSLAFLKQNPFVVHDNGFIKGVIILDHNPDKTELRSLFARYYIPELASLIVVSYYHDSTVQLSSETNSPPLCDQIRDLAGPLQNICGLMQEKGYRTKLMELKSMP
jgi:hypothetical protein